LILDTIVENFHDETPGVQLLFLIAQVKLYRFSPEPSQNQLQLFFLKLPKKHPFQMIEIVD
jgi:hypothetical protein